MLILLRVKHLVFLLIAHMTKELLKVAVTMLPTLRIFLKEIEHDWFPWHTQHVVLLFRCRYASEFVFPDRVFKLKHAML